MFDIDFSRYRVVDLSYAVVPGENPERPFEIEKGLLPDRAFKYDVKTHTHVGTHVEAPAHFFEDGKDVSQLPLNAYMGRAVLLDVKDAEANMEVNARYMEETIGDLIEEGDIVICMNRDERSIRSGEHQNFPYFTPDGARWLADHKVKMVGIDNYFRLGLDISMDREFHDILMSKDVTFVEWLDNLDQLTKREFYFMALPFKVRNLDSSWARAVAIEEL